MPRRRYPWVKLWFDDLGDAGMRQLTMAEKGCWWGMKILAGKSPERGKLQFSSGLPMTTDQIAQALGLPLDERPILDSTIKKMTNLGELHANSECLVIVNWKSEQEVYPSDFEDYHGQAKKPESSSGEEPSVATGASASLFPDIFLESSALTPDTLLKDERGKKKEERRKTKETLGRNTRDTVQPLSEVGLQSLQPPGTKPAKQAGVADAEKADGSTVGTREGVEVTPKKQTDEQKAKQSEISLVIQAVYDHYGYKKDGTGKTTINPVPFPGKEAKSISRMLQRGFTREQIIDSWKKRVEARGAFVSFVYVNEDIGQPERSPSGTGRAGGRSAAPQQDPGAKPDYKASIRRFQERHG